MMSQPIRLTGFKGCILVKIIMEFSGLSLWTFQEVEISCDRKVSLANNDSLWPQILTECVSFWAQKLAECVNFWAQKLAECVSFWAQKLTLWARDTILFSLQNHHIASKTITHHNSEGNLILLKERITILVYMTISR